MKGRYENGRRIIFNQAQARDSASELLRNMWGCTVVLPSQRLGRMRHCPWCPVLELSPAPGYPRYVYWLPFSTATTPPKKQGKNWGMPCFLDGRIIPTHGVGSTPAQLFRWSALLCLQSHPVQLVGAGVKGMSSSFLTISWGSRESRGRRSPSGPPCFFLLEGRRMLGCQKFLAHMVCLPHSYAQQHYHKLHSLTAKLVSWSVNHLSQASQVSKQMRAVAVQTLFLYGRRERTRLENSPRLLYL